jgi:hypothetical protein
MTVAELIARLQELPPDMVITTYDGYDAELDEALGEVTVENHPYRRGSKVVVIK